MSAATFGPAAAGYLRTRGIDLELAARVGVRDDGDAVVWPTVDVDGQPAPRRRTLNGARAKVLGPPGRSPGLWWPSGTPEAGGAVLLTEGESDALSALTALELEAADPDGAARFARSYLAAVAAMPGTTFPGGRLVEALCAVDVREAVVALDGDEPGRTAAADVARTLRDAGIRPRRLSLPDGSDLAECLAGEDRPATWLAERIAEASTAVDDDASDRAATEALRFVSAAELVTLTPHEPAWILEGLVARGAVTLAAGKPKSGKSTLACALAEAVAADAESFLGRRVGGGAVVYVSEEGAGTLAHKLPRVDRVRVLTRDAAWPKPKWSALIAAAVQEAQRVGAVLLVVDALSFWAGFAEGQEKDAGVAQAVMDALAAATRAGLAVLVVHHQRKAGGEDGDAVRGSGAIFGAADVLLEVERAGQDAPATYRRLVTTGRWPSAAPVLVVEREPSRGAWRVIGQAEDRDGASGVSHRERLLRALPTEEPGVTEDRLAALLDVDKRKIGDPLRELVSEGLATRSGAGRRGDPYLYTAPPDVSAPVSAPAGGRNADADSAPPRRGAASNSDSACRPGAETGSNGDDALDRADGSALEPDAEPAP